MNEGLDVVEIASNEDVVIASDVGRVMPATVVSKDPEDPRSTKALKLCKVLHSVPESWRNSGVGPGTKLGVAEMEVSGMLLLCTLLKCSSRLSFRGNGFPTAFL